jgi:hypothetical protein
MLIIDMSAVKLPGEAKQNNLPHEYGQPIDDSDTATLAIMTLLFKSEYAHPTANESRPIQYCFSVS